jgi:signal transduction histidine kinase/CheY-like chemotaxis protein
MKYILPFFISFILVLPLSAQTRTESLWAVWSDESQPVVTRLEAIDSIHLDPYGRFLPTNLDTAFYHAELQYALAEENDLIKWMATALVSKGNYYSQKSLFNKAIDHYTQSKTIGEEIGDKKVISTSLFNLGVIYFKRGEGDQGLLVLIQAIELYNELGKKYEEAQALAMVGMIYNFQKSDIKKAIPFLKRSLAIREELLKTDDTQENRFVVNGMKGTIKSLEEPLEAITDIIDLDSYIPEISEEDIVVSSTPDVEVIKGQGENVEEISKGTVLNSPDPTLAKDLAIVEPASMKQYEGGAGVEELLKLVEIYEAAGEKAAVAERLLMVGSVYVAKSDYENAVKYLLKAVVNSEALGNENNTAAALEQLGRAYLLLGDIDKAIESLSRSRYLIKKVGNESAEARINIFIADVYFRQGEFAKALELDHQSLAYYRNVGNRAAEAGVLSSIGNNYGSQGENEKALEHIKEALNIFEEIPNLRGVAGASLGLGGVYFSEKNNVLALDYLARSLTIFEKIGDENGMMLSHGGIASVYGFQKRHDKAISFGNKALSLAQKAGDLRSVKNGTEMLSVSYKARGNYRKALEMTELYYEARDSLQSAENQKAIIQLQVSSEYEKQKVIDDAENQKLVAIETQKKVNQQKLSVAIGIGLLLISLLSLVIFSRLKVTRKQKAIIEEQKKKVEQSEKYKEQFLANMSHEIRTPMHAISGMVKILERKDHPPAQDVYLNAMQVSSENLVVILNDVLDLSKIEAGKLDIESIPVRPAAIIENVAQILKYKAEEKGLKLTYEIEEEVPAVVMGDPTRLNQILLNLAGNAIKFTKKGNVEVLLSKADDRLRFSVKDTGIGIPKDKLDAIFGAFEQVGDDTSRHFGGTGLGLSISKQLTELQGGRIWAESEVGQGSTFWVDLPIVAAEVGIVSQDLISEEHIKTMAASLKGMRVLVAEDNPFNQMIVQDDLSYYFEGVTIDVVENGALVVEKFNAGDYDLILMDVQMPKLNGFEATRKIRAIEKEAGTGKAIPIVAMTASLLKSEVANCYTAGMDNYIPKPYKAVELVGTIYEELGPSVIYQ